MANFSTLWQFYRGTSDETKNLIGSQIMRQITGKPISDVTSILEGAPSEVKERVWKFWAERADLSGYTVETILDVLKSEPSVSSQAVVSSWVHRVDLRFYSPEQMKKIATLITSYDDVKSLWTRWAQATELRRYEIVWFSHKVLAGLTAEIALSIVGEWVKQCGDTLKEYDRETIRKLNTPLPHNVYRKIADAWNVRAQIPENVSDHLAELMKMRDEMEQRARR